MANKWCVPWVRLMPNSLFTKLASHIIPHHVPGLLSYASPVEDKPFIRKVNPACLRDRRKRQATALLSHPRPQSIFRSCVLPLSSVLIGRRFMKIFQAP